MKKSGLLFLSLMSFTLLCGFGGKHSTVETKATVIGQNLEVDLLVKPNAGMMLTKEGPWQVTFKQSPGLQLEWKDGKYTSKQFDEKLPGFKIKTPVDDKALSGTVDYELRAFVCTVDKKQCFPQMHVGRFSWKKNT